MGTVIPLESARLNKVTPIAEVCTNLFLAFDCGNKDKKNAVEIGDTILDCWIQLDILGRSFAVFEQLMDALLFDRQLIDLIEVSRVSKKGLRVFVHKDEQKLYIDSKINEIDADEQLKIITELTGKLIRLKQSRDNSIRKVSNESM